MKPYEDLEFSAGKQVSDLLDDETVATGKTTAVSSKKTAATGKGSGNKTAASGKSKKS
jgi:hypothetical protein